MTQEHTQADTEQTQQHREQEAQSTHGHGEVQRFLHREKGGTNRLLVRFWASATTTAFDTVPNWEKAACKICRRGKRHGRQVRNETWLCVLLQY